MTELLTESSDVRWFPVIVDRTARPMGNKIPWRLAEIVYEGYSRRYGTDQSLERIAERGGFGILEIADHLLVGLKARDEAHKDCHIVAHRHNQFQRRLSEALQRLRVPGRFHQYNSDGIHLSDCSGCELLHILEGTK